MEPLPQTGKLQGRFDKGYKLPGAQRGDHCLKVTFFFIYRKQHYICDEA